MSRERQPERFPLLRRVFRLPLTRGRAARQVDEELQFHFDERVEELVSRGMTRGDALAEVQRKFGDVASVRDACVQIDTRRARVSTVRDALAGFGQDAWFAARTLRRRPVFAMTALLTLALGIGATTAMFTVVDGVLLRPLPYRDPARLATIYTTFPYWQGQAVVGVKWNRLRTPYPDYVSLIKSQRSFTDVAGFQVSSASLPVGDQTASVGEGFGTANLLSVLGVSPAIGRWFLPGEDGPGAPRLAVLSHGLWRTRFGGDSGVVGRTIRIDEEPFVVVGVLPRAFALTAEQVETNGSIPPDLWIPFGVYPGMLIAGNHTLELIGRLRPGVSVAAARVDIEPLLRGARRPERRGADVLPRADVETREVQRPLLLLFASVGLLLLITCGNIAMLFLSECVVRESELRTRAVLGAGRGRLVRLLLTESAVLATAGAAAGAMLGWWGARVLLALAPTELPHARMVGLNARALLFTIGVAAMVALVSGMLPAVTLTRRDAGGGARNRVASGRSRLQTTVIAVQACLSVVLMTGAGLLARSVLNEQRVNPGFRATNMLALRVDLPSSVDRERGDRYRLYDEVTRALETLPGAVRVTSSMTLPLSGRANGQAVSVPPEIKLGAPGSAESERAVVSTNYFDVLRIPLLAGRVFTAQDVDSAPLVAVVSEGFARRFWPGESAIGKTFRSPAGVSAVVGIVGDVKNKALTREPESVFYRPQRQSGARLAFIVETRGDPLELVTAAERAVWAAVPGATVSEVTSLDALVGRAMAPARYRALLASIFAGLALLLTAVGLTGLTARGVANRLRELCIRMALGATPGRALASALTGGLTAVVSGLAAGVLVSPFAARTLAEYLYEVSARDAATHAVTTVVALAVCIVATIVATKRLRDADLAAVLRSD